MSGTEDLLNLVDWRRQVTRMYVDVRRAPAAGRVIAWNEWRAARNDLFKRHQQSPLSAGQRARFRSLDYYPYDDAWRIEASIRPDKNSNSYNYELGPDGRLTMKRIGWLVFRIGQKESRLGLFWIEGYGGGLFLPFKDATNAHESYGGGRYLYDTIKGVDLGATSDQILIDFNYAYNPSCAYHSRWVCPLPPPENSLPFAISAGEKRFGDSE